MIIIVIKGIFDMVYLLFIFVSMVVVFGWDVVVFYMFWGFDIFYEKKLKNLKFSVVGNLSMLMLNVVVVLFFMDSVVMSMMEKKIQKNGIVIVEEFIEIFFDMGVDFQVCQMIIELMGYDEVEFYDGVIIGVGVVMVFQYMVDVDV